jgi:hypothetical protein
MGLISPAAAPPKNADSAKITALIRHTVKTFIFEEVILSCELNPIEYIPEL